MEGVAIPVMRVQYGYILRGLLIYIVILSLIPLAFTLANPHNFRHFLFKSVIVFSNLNFYDMLIYLFGVFTIILLYKLSWYFVWRETKEYSVRREYPAKDERRYPSLLVLNYALRDRTVRWVLYAIPVLEETVYRLILSFLIIFDVTLLCLECRVLLFIVLSSALYSASHGYYGKWYARYIFSLGVILSILFVLTGYNLLYVVFLHELHNVLMLNYRRGRR